jgi:3-hydroxyisobutyrate dehydrogenase-like beta-hydroxyacid dehydrogenase
MVIRPIRTVGVIGLGVMGQPIANHIARGGFKVVGFDSNPARLISAGTHVIAARSCADLARQSDLVLVVVGFDAEVHAVLFNEEGVLDGAREGTIIVIASTVSPRTMTHLRSRLDGKPVHLLDAPVARGEDAARAGKLFAFVGGDNEAVAAARPVLGTFADTIHHLGGTGAGQIGKIVNSLIFWACVCANHEGMKLGHGFGLDPRALRAAVLESTGQNWALSTDAGAKPAPTAEKDLMIVMQEADELRIGLPLCGAVKEVITAIKLERSRSNAGDV